MKKWLIGIVLLLGVLIAAKQLSHNDYSSAKKLAEAGNYQAFYSEIKADVAKGDEDATDVLIFYFLKAVYDGDIAEAKFYIDNNPSLINKEDKDGDRAMDIVILLTKQNKIDMVNTLLDFNPDLNYRRTKPENLTYTEEFFLFLPKINHSFEILTLLVDHGMNVNNFGKPDTNDNCLPPLVRSYLYNNFQIFDFLLPYTKNLNPTNQRKDNHATLIEKIAFSYVSEIQNAGAKLEHPANEQLWSVIRSEKYRVLHQKNMQYVQALLKHDLINKVSEKELRSLFVYYASVGEMDGTKLFVDHGICEKYPNLCMEAIKVAGINNFTKIEKLIGEK